MTLPNFIVIGAEKSGTTYLKHNLNLHSEVYIPPQKELHFFDVDENWKKKLNWYRQYFSDANAKKAVGEITPAYLISPHVPERICSLFPDMKLIAILRNPMERAYSAYWMGVANATIVCSFDDAIKAHPNLLEGGFYGSQLLRYRKYFSLDQMLILKYDQIKSPKVLFPRIFSFLGVASDVMPERSGERIFSSQIPRMMSVNQLVHHINRIAGRYFSQNTKKQARHFLNKWNTRNAPYPPLSIETRNELIKYFLNDMIILERELGLDCQDWKL